MADKISFEESMTKLDEAVRRLESGSMSLDESLSAFEEAIGLIKICNEKLDKAERKVKLLIESADGSVTDKPFEEKCDEA